MNVSSDAHEYSSWVLGHVADVARADSTSVAHPASSPDVAKTAGLRSPTTPTPDDTPAGSYQVVYETPGPHATLATAQALPDVTFFGIVGVLQPNEPMDLFQIPIDPRTLSLQFTLKLDDTERVPAALQLFDAQGHSLGVSSLTDGPQGQTLSVSGANQLPGSVLYLGIIPAGASDAGTSTAPVSYQVWILRQRTSDPAPDTSTALASASIPAGPLPLFPAPARPDLVPSSPGPIQAPGAVAPADPPAPRPVIVGPLPTLSAAPSGGVLLDRDADQPVDRLVIVEADLDHPSRDADPSPHAVADDTEPGPLEETPALVAWHGPGGYPLLGAAPTGDWRGPRTAALGGGEAVLGADDHDHPVPTSSEPAIEVAGARARDIPTPESPPKHPPAPIRTGLSMAVALAFGLLFSDPAAIFHSIVALRRPPLSGPPRASKGAEDSRRRG